MTDFDKKSLKNYDVWYYMSVQVINRLTHYIINEQDAMVSMDTNDTREAIQGHTENNLDLIFWYQLELST